jgi:hypothetical protein
MCVNLLNSSGGKGIAQQWACDQVGHGMVEPVTIRLRATWKSAWNAESHSVVAEPAVTTMHATTLSHAL